MSSDEEENVLKKVSLDNILVEELGQFGRYQLIIFLLASLPNVFWTLSSTEYIFTSSRIPTRCLIPECDGTNPAFAPEWRDAAIPQHASGAFDQCSRFGSNSSLSPSDSCPASLFNTSFVVPCERYVYQNDLTIVYDFDLGCDEWRRSFVGTIKATGAFLSLPLTGYVSDRWGRRMALALTAFSSGFFGLLRSFVSSYEWFVPLVFVEAILGSGTFSCTYLLTMELVGPKYRVIAGALCIAVVSLSHGLLGLLAWSVPHWRTLTQIVYAPQLLFISYLWIISESVRWLMSKRRYEEAEQVLRKVAISNKTSLSSKSVKSLQASAEMEKNTKKPKEQWLLILVFKSPEMLKRCVFISFCWVTNMLIYYGMSVNAVNLSGNSYLNYSIVGLIDIPGRFLAVSVLDRIGRKAVILCAYFICSACQLAFILLSGGTGGLALVVYLVGKSCIAAISTSVHVFTVELFPTVHRHQLFAFASMMGRLGSMMAPLTPSLAQKVWGPLPSVLFGSFALLSALLILTLPETLGTKLPETMEDAEKIRSNKIT